MNFKPTIPGIVLVVLLTACARSDSDYKLPGVYRISVQQGNVIQQEMIDQLKAGMEKHQVRFIMGTPTIIDPFHPDRWDYIYTFTPGADRRIQRKLTVYFVDERLAYLEGDVQTSLSPPPDTIRNRSRIVDVPDRTRRERGLISSILDRLPGGGEDYDTPEVEEIMDEEDQAPSDQVVKEQDGTEDDT